MYDYLIFMATIPKVMHFIWFQGKDKIPEKYNTNMNTFMELNPLWNTQIWDEESLENECKKYSNRCYYIWKKLPTIMMKIELGRYVILYNYGGISIDMDMICIKSLDSIPNINNNKCIISEMNLSSIVCRILSIGLYSSLINNATIACIKNNIFINNLINIIINKHYYQIIYFLLPITISTVNITGSVVLTKQYLKYKDQVHLLPKEYIEMNNSNKNSIIVHFHELSWTKKWERYIRDLFG